MAFMQGKQHDQITVLDISIHIWIRILVTCGYNILRKKKKPTTTDIFSFIITNIDAN